ncbi:MAG: mechanosensitive ion channel domain-containing protein [Phocaeicola sp.]
MKQFLFLIAIISSLCSIKLAAQNSESQELSLTDTTQLQSSRQDSIQIAKLMQELEAAKQRESDTELELAQLKLETFSADSLKRIKQRAAIDSLRAQHKGFPVVVEEDTLFSLYAKRGGYTPQARAELNADNITELGKQFMLSPDSLYIEHSDIVTDIMYGGKVIISFTDSDALWENTTREELAKSVRNVVVIKLREMHEKYSLLQYAKHTLYFLLVLLGQYIFWRLTNLLHRRAKVWIHSIKETKLKSFSIQEYEVLDTRRQESLLFFLANMVRYLILGLQLLFSVPLLFSIFPQTKDLAYRILDYIWSPIKNIFNGIIEYIPNLFTIVIIYLSIKYFIKGIKYLADEIDSERLKLSGFYADWAMPTYHIIRFLMYAFMVAMIYPYLPGSKSGIFQGVSVFVGLIVSLGSSTVIGNIIAGLVITYMRPFKLGDRIKLNDTTGNVTEKTAFVTRIRTPKNEIVTIPNSFIMSSHTVNYSASARDHGLIIHSEVTIGYDAPWRKVHQLLIDAALATHGIEKSPEPFILETALSDYYPVYQINAYIREADKMALIYSELHQNIQDHFNRAGVEIMSPQFTAFRNGNKSTIPEEKG